MSVLRFFHGTHEINAQKIEQEGLVPLAKPSSSFRGNMSTIWGYTDKLVFLAPSIEEAAFYAEENARRYNSKPVIFEVLIRDQTLLRVSDDFIFSQTLDAMVKTSNIPGPHYDEDGDLHQYGESTEIIWGWRDIISANPRSLLGAAAFDANTFILRDDASIDTIPEFIESMCQNMDVPAVWAAMCEAARAAFLSDWRKSIATDRDPAVGYMGSVTPENLKRVSPNATMRAIKSHSRGLGAPATWDLEVEFA